MFAASIATMLSLIEIGKKYSPLLEVKFEVAGGFCANLARRDLKYHLLSRSKLWEGINGRFLWSRIALTCPH
jgi:hypothetical protein